MKTDPDTGGDSNAAPENSGVARARRREVEPDPIAIGDARLLRDELTAIYASPGWRLVSAYRDCLQTIRLRWPGLYRRYAPLATRITTWLTGSASAPAPSGLTALYREWIEANEPGRAELVRQRELASSLPYRPLISVLLPVFRVPLAVLAEAVESVLGQTYDLWELCIAHGDPEDAKARTYLAELAARDTRVKLRMLDSNLGISGNSNAALQQASGEFVALLDHDDTLAPFALFEVARVLNKKPALDILYSDSDELEEGGSRTKPFFKPDWSASLMLSANYVTHLTVIRRARVLEVEGFRRETDGAQDWDLFVRVAARTSRPEHIPKVLYHWRHIETSVSRRGIAAKPYAAQAQLRTLRDYIEAKGWRAEPGLLGDASIRLRWPAADRPLVSVIVISEQFSTSGLRKAAQLVRAAGSLLLEIVAPMMTPEASTHPGVKVVPTGPDPNVAETLNRVAAGCSGEIILFLDDALTRPSDDWLAEMAGPIRSGIAGMVGATLLDGRTRAIRSAGIVFDAGGRAQDLFSGLQEDASSPFGESTWYRDLLAVSGACFSIRRDVFLDLGGFSKTPMYPRLDIDLCLRFRFKTGLNVLCNPFARFRQRQRALLESPAPSLPNDGAAYMRSLFPGGDPCFNPNLRHGETGIAFRTTRGEARELTPGDTPALQPEGSSLWDFTATDLRESQLACSAGDRGAIETITWFLPDFAHPYYGGVHTVLRFADHFLRAHQVRSRFVVLPPTEEGVIKERIASAFPELGDTSQVRVLHGHSVLRDLEPSDVAVATFWVTAYHLLRFNRVRRKFYFLQDDERMFFAASTLSARVESTYGFGFLGIANSIGVRDRLFGTGGSAEYFDPCVDPAVFHPPEDVGKPRDGRPRTLFCYARPGHPRNCFELAAAALRIVKSRLGDRVRIVTAGADFEARSYGLGEVAENRGLLDYRQTASLYRTCDAGLVMMMTCHPSYVPMELTACGALAISNRNPHTQWLLKDRVNCLLAGNSPSSIADAVEEGLTDDELRRRLVLEGQKLISAHYSRWDDQAEKIYGYILRNS